MMAVSASSMSDEPRSSYSATTPQPPSSRGVVARRAGGGTGTGTGTSASSSMNHNDKKKSLVRNTRRVKQTSSDKSKATTTKSAPPPAHPRPPAPSATHHASTTTQTTTSNKKGWGKRLRQRFFGGGGGGGGGATTAVHSSTNGQQQQQRRNSGMERAASAYTHRTTTLTNSTPAAAPPPSRAMSTSAVTQGGMAPTGAGIHNHSYYAHPSPRRGGGSRPVEFAHTSEPQSYAGTTGAIDSRHMHQNQHSPKPKALHGSYFNGEPMMHRKSGPATTTTSGSPRQSVSYYQPTTTDANSNMMMSARDFRQPMNSYAYTREDESYTNVANQEIDEDLEVSYFNPN